MPITNRLFFTSCATVCVVVVCIVFLSPNSQDLQGGSAETGSEKEVKDSFRKNGDGAYSTRSSRRNSRAKIRGDRSGKVVSVPTFGKITESNAVDKIKILKRDTEKWSLQKAEFYQAWGQVAPRSAISYAQANEESSASALAGQVVKGWAKEDHLSAQAWILEQRGAEKVLFGKILLAEMDDDAWNQKSDWISQFSEGVSGSAVVRDFSKKWAAVEPADSITWVLTLEDNSSRKGALKSVIKTWANDDIAAVGNYFEQMEQGRPRDEALSIFADRVALINRASAREWAELISDAGIRNKVLDNL